MTFYKAWLVDDPDFSKVIEIDWEREGWDARVMPMDVKNHLCRHGYFEWKDYVKIRFKKLEGRARTRVKMKTWYLDDAGYWLNRKGMP